MRMRMHAAHARLPTCCCCAWITLLLPHLAAHCCCCYCRELLRPGPTATTVCMHLRMYVGPSGPLRFPRAWGTTTPEGTTSVRAHFLCLVMQHLEHKSICCNVRPKHIKHLQHTLATYVYGHCNICNIQIKHLQHVLQTTEIFETYTCNICV
jgi:hypothetical protein